MKIKIKNFLHILGAFKLRYYKAISIYASSSVIDILVLSLLPFLISSFLGKESNLNFFNFDILLNENNGILIIGSMILFLTFFKGFFNYFSILNSIKLSSELQMYNREKIFSFYKGVYVDDISKDNQDKYLNYTAYVVSVFSENIVFKSITVVSEILIVLIVCIYLGFVNFFALLGLVAFFSIVLVGYFLLIKKKLYNTGIKQSQAMEKLVEIINSVFKGFKEIKVLKIEKYFDAKFKDFNNQYNKNFIDYQKLIFVPKYLLEIVMITFILMFFFFTSYLTNKPLTSYFELFGIFLFASLRITPLAYNIFSSVSQIFASWYAVTDLASEFKKIDYKHKKIITLEENKKLIKLNSIEKIHLKNINFKYDLNNDLVLNNLNLEIKSGTCIGIKGDSGTGKTTLVNIILGLLKINKGKIIVNNNLNYIETNIKNRMSYTPQDIFLIKGSILENIALGQKKDEIDIQSLYDCAVNAQVIQFIKKEKQDKTIEEILGSHNVENLSGGQAQRIAIARNLYFKKDINIFDEFTSALDVNAEDKIVKHLNKIKQNKIIIIVSHRMNAMKYCDSIYELKNGTLKKI
jgi:ATP-binding cassette, subfamily B, bacterial PglK